MIEVKIRNYLIEKLHTNNVFLETPKTGDDYIVFTIVDRSRENLIDAVTVRFYSYSTSKPNAALLDESVRNAILEIPEYQDITSARLSGGGDAFDTLLKKYRYACYFNLTYMEG